MIKDKKNYRCTYIKLLCFHPTVSWAVQDLQGGELAHVSEGRVGQRVDLVVAQVSEGKIQKAHVQCVDHHGEIEEEDRQTLTPAGGICRSTVPLARH